jgi:hypothetical protein
MINLLVVVEVTALLPKAPSKIYKRVQTIATVKNAHFYEKMQVFFIKRQKNCISTEKLRFFTLYSLSAFGFQLSAP